MNFEEFKEYIIRNSKKIGLLFNEKQLEQFYEYKKLLLEWNEKMNLTAIVEDEEIILKHFIDSLTIEKYIENNGTIADVGTGAGFPGIPLKIYRPDLKIVLIDSLNKRISFLDEVIKKLELEKIEAIHSRIEDIGNKESYREKFEYVTARAVANLSTLSEYLLPLAKIGGKCICMKGISMEEELKEAANAINILGGKVIEKDKLNLPNSDIERNIIIIEKIKNTPKTYPRKAGKPSKEPLK